jgi:hypothetical protein
MSDFMNRQLPDYCPAQKLINQLKIQHIQIISLTSAGPMITAGAGKLLGFDLPPFDPLPYHNLWLSFRAQVNFRIRLPERKKDGWPKQLGSAAPLP